jgi:hypothetical protein
MQWESRRQSCLKIDLFSADGVVEFQILGVQEISSIAGTTAKIRQLLAKAQKETIVTGWDRYP